MTPALKGASVVLALLLTGCCHDVLEPEQTEDGVVEDTVYTPATHGSGVGPAIDMSGRGGMSVAIVSIDTEPVWAVVFRCKHGKFIIERKDVWQSVHPGELVTIHYQARYCVKGDKAVFKGYYFIRADPRP